MKSRLRSLLLSSFLLPAALHASTTAPMFAGSPGTTLTIHGQTFTWTSPATEDGTWHTDTYTYTDSGTAATYTVTVKGLITNPNLATVIGSDATAAVNGYLSGGTYGDCQTSSVSDGSWTVYGVNYTHLVAQSNYSVDFYNWELNNIYDTQYSSADGSIHFWGNTSLDESHWFSVGNSTPPSSGMSSINAFGTTYTYSAPLSSRSQDEVSDDEVLTTTRWTDTYTSASGTLQITYYHYTSYPAVTTYTVQVWNQDFGTVTSNPVSTLPDSSLTGVTWSARTAPTFAKPQLWLDGKLLTWQSGTATSAGLLTDTYSGAGATLTVSASALDYFVSGGNATVTITSSGGGSGTLAHDGTFTLTGHVLQNAEPNHSAPLFVSGTTVLQLSHILYAFTGGFQDSLGNRLDVYVNPSYGVITLSGTASNSSHASVKASRSSYIYSGTYDSGDFSISPAITAPSASQLSIYGPPAFWVRGEFYQQSATTPTSYASASGHTLILSGTSTWTLSGADATGAFSGTCSHDPIGIFLIQALDESSQPIADSFVPVLPANADGTLHLSWASAPSGMPPAVIDKNLHQLVYLGTAADDTSPASTAAYYGSAVISGQTPWLLKIRTDGSTTTPYTATFTDYSTVTSTTAATTSIGSYSTQTHLFQTSSLASGFPMPVNGVDPTSNFALWGLTQPDSATGLPATFLVQGDIWRYTGTGTSGAATYIGYYSSPETGTQTMTVAAPDASGARIVTVTDPYHGDGTPAQGTLNDVRGSARLRDGTEVYSGNFSGEQINPTLSDSNLHTIAADLDITGNVITFGALTSNAATAGVTLQFQDTAAGDGSYTGSFYSMLARPQAQWVWARTASSTSQSTLPVMKLDPTHKLTLYDSPAVTGQSQNAGVVLDPTPGGTSTIRGILRVRPGGDIDMGEFTATPDGVPAP